jgi:hypothetical protein
MRPPALIIPDAVILPLDTAFRIPGAGLTLTLVADSKLPAMPPIYESTAAAVSSRLPSPRQFVRLAAEMYPTIPPT